MLSRMDDAEHDSCELEMPFVTVTDHGGPHDTDSYAAGFEMGQLDSELRSLANLASGRPAGMRAHVHTVNLPQADLIAMRYGMTMRVLEHGGHAEGCAWSGVEFTVTVV
ncbi:hypothetical protein JDBV14_00680 [Mycobacterium phage harman]|nr:hypothetical protein JDBV14_00680 [Mycobacterium phage harman]